MKLSRRIQHLVRASQPDCRSRFTEQNRPVVLLPTVAKQNDRHLAFPAESQLGQRGSVGE